MYHGSNRIQPLASSATPKTEDLRKGALQRAFLASRGVPWQAIEDMGAVYRGVMVEAFEEVERIEAARRAGAPRSAPAEPAVDPDEPTGVDFA